jgi:hypothetical protein
MPWFEVRFVPTDAFPGSSRFFAKRASFQSHGIAMPARGSPFWERIWAEGVAPALADGTRVEPDFTVHIYDDGTARFRY